MCWVAKISQASEHHIEITIVGLACMQGAIPSKAFNNLLKQVDFINPQSLMPGGHPVT